MRKIVREATFGLTEIESEDIWRCTTCGRCPQQCPRDVKQIESGVSLRRVATEYGVFPKPVRAIRTVSASLIGEGNPLNEERMKRANWAEGLSVETFTEEMEIETKLLSSMKYSGKVGAFEGASYEAKGFYRPQADCIMFTRDEVGFCAVCRRGIQVIMDLYTASR